ncbi:hypothetical protein RvY_08210 [Ramazzottius varieornatus]|uniref:2'-phosphotransferase n=1 Tax=Ramazzottius varieornatus TaxID=947166 RepID=A0A1D1V550_RAMVA|nr:hypothetical protein RvY_08210 [Ramazzottius varieornatus]
MKGARLRGFKHDSPEVRTSKTLSWILRHGAVDRGIQLTKDGYAKVDDILSQLEFSTTTVEDIRRLVREDKKTRYSLRDDNGVLLICANQGHSIPVEELSLKPITSSEDYPQVIHGTYRKNMKSILKSGLKPMTRNHIHFSKGEPSADMAVSGIRANCDVLIYLDVDKALKDGIPLFESANGVVLSPGNADKCIPSTYFLKVVDRVHGKLVPAPNK